MGIRTTARSCGFWLLLRSTSTLHVTLLNILTVFFIYHCCNHFSQLSRTHVTSSTILSKGVNVPHFSPFTLSHTFHTKSDIMATLPFLPITMSFLSCFNYCGHSKLAQQNSIYLVFSLLLPPLIIFGVATG